MLVLLTQLLIHFRGDDQFMWSKQRPLVMDAGQIHMIIIMHLAEGFLQMG